MGNSTNQPILQGDRPLAPDGHDELGFKDLSRVLAEALSRRSAQGGMTIGLEGRWGSGKSSLVNLIVQELEQLDEPRPTVLKFEPWLIGNRDALITSFFEELARTIAGIRKGRGDATSASVQAAEDLAKKLRLYAGYLGALAPAASLASVLNIPGSEVASRVLKGLRSFSKESKVERKPLVELKVDIETSLKSMNAPIVVFIDDVDRLDPGEITEILRLVRSVADFPNVTYVLCYDPTIVSEAVQTTINIKEGVSYLEKIFQMTARVPAPEPFALRRMFERRLSEFMTIDDRAKAGRLAELIDVKGGAFLPTPRAVNRTLDALRFVYPTLRGKIDEPDLVWITFIRLNSPSLFDWIERYLASMAAVSSGRVSVTKESIKDEFDQLREILEIKANDEKIRKLPDLADYLPGVDTYNLNRDDHMPIYRLVGEPDRARAVANKRLSSPDHFRYYFALTIPSSAPREEEFREFFTAAERGKEPLKSFLLSKGTVSAGPMGTRLEVILDRIRTGSTEALSPIAAKATLFALADVLDEPELLKEIDSFLGPQLWREAELLLPRLKGALVGDFQGAIVEAFAQGKALGWLTDLLRHETLRMAATVISVSLRRNGFYRKLNWMPSFP